MSTQVLEQMLDSVPVRLQERAYQTLDMQVGPAAMYCQWNPFCNCPNGRQTPDMMNQMFGTPARDPALGDPGMGSRQTTLNEYTIPEPPKQFGGNIGQIPGLPSSPINPVVVPYGNQTGLGGDVHDTFRIDRYDNLYGGHTSIKIPGYEPFRMPWEK